MARREVRCTEISNFWFLINIYLRNVGASRRRKTGTKPGCFLPSECWGESPRLGALLGRVRARGTGSHTPTSGQKSLLQRISVSWTNHLINSQQAMWCEESPWERPLPPLRTPPPILHIASLYTAASPHDSPVSNIYSIRNLHFCLFYSNTCYSCVNLTLFHLNKVY